MRNDAPNYRAGVLQGSRVHRAIQAVPAVATAAARWTVAAYLVDESKRADIPVEPAVLRHDERSEPVSNTCEHGHLARVCEVCELKAEVQRLREVCKRGADEIDVVLRTTRQDKSTHNQLGTLACSLANEGSKDGK